MTYADALAVGRAKWRARAILAPHSVVRPGESVAIRVHNRNYDVIFAVERRARLLPLKLAVRATCAGASNQLIDYIEQGGAGDPFARVRQRIKPNKIRVSGIVDQLERFYWPIFGAPSNGEHVNVRVASGQLVEEGVNLLERVILVEPERAVERGAELGRSR